MKYLSLCSGIEAATQAWHPLGMQPVAFSEIEPFPSAVLAHHYPHVPNWGDMTKFQEWPDADVDVLVGGTPCQSFSVAGLRKGLADPRGNLMLTYLAIAARYRPRWLVWENVPGVLSSNKGRDFGTFLGALGELGYGFAYRVLDAQYVRTCRFGRAVPQRRRRVFVVGYLGDWRRAAAVLFDRESLSGHPAPRREAGKGLTHDAAQSLVSSGRGVERAGDTRGQDPVIGIVAADVAPTLNAHFGEKQGLEDQHINGGAGLFVAHALRGEGFDASEDGTGRGTPIVPVHLASGKYDDWKCPACGEDNGAAWWPTCEWCDHKTVHSLPIAIQERAICENPNAGPDGAGIRTDGAAYTLEARTVSQVVALDLNQITSKTNRSRPDPAVHHTLPATSTPPHLAVAWSIMPQNSGKDYKARAVDVAQPIMAAGPTGGNQGGDYIQTPWAVRRLTPRECERLQGFPDDFTKIPYRGKPAEKCPDGPRYKALGNSMAVNCMEWIGERMMEVDGWAERAAA